MSNVALSQPESQNTRPSDEFRLPYISAFLAITSVVSCITSAARSGDVVWAGPLALLSGFFALGSTVRYLDESRRLRKARKAYKTFVAQGRELADTGHATDQAIRDAGLMSRRGIVLGFHTDANNKRHVLRHDSERAMTVIGPPGSHKSTSIFMPTLQPLDGKIGIDSFIANDPAGQLYQSSHDALRAAGFEIRTLCPWPEEMSRQLGMRIVDSGLDWYSDLDPEGSVAHIVDTIRNKSKLLFVVDPKRSDMNAEFFVESAGELFTYCNLYCIAAGRKPTLPMIHTMLLEDDETFRSRLEASLGSSALAGSLSRCARTVLKHMNATDQWSGVFGQVTKTLSIFEAGGAMGNHLSEDGAKLESVKGDKPVAIFVMYPANRSLSHGKAINLTFGHAFEVVANHPDHHKRVHALLDETASMGKMPTLTKAINEYRKFGLVVVPVFQDLYGQTEEIYGKYAVKQILAGSETIWTSNVREPETLKMLSEAAGETTIVDGNLTDAKDGKDSAVANQHSWTHKTRPYLRAEEIRRLPSDRALIIHANLEPLIVTKSPWWSLRSWKRSVEKSFKNKGN